MAMSSPGSAKGRRRGRRARAPISEINVTPFVDVMLVLLIIFMVTAPLLKAGVPVELPESRAKALAEERLQVALSIDGRGAIFLEEVPVALDELPSRLSALPRAPGGGMPLVTLRADKTNSHGLVMAVMGELNRAGITSISLVTRASARAPSRPSSIIQRSDVEE